MKNFLLTGARFTSTLDLARQLHASGHNVIAADTAKWDICSLSNAVKNKYVVPGPRQDPEGFVETLAHIVEKERIDYLIPTYEEIIYLAKHLDKFPSRCRVLSDSFDKLRRLHNKWLFYQMQVELNIDVPRSYLLKSEEDLKNLPRSTSYALKPCYSRASLHLKKLEPADPLPDLAFDERNPWIAQEWIQGNKFCTYGICQDGLVKAHALYPVQYAIDGNSCLNFEAIEHPRILEWIKKFVLLTNFTGQIGFDFIETPDGKLYAIECNPRATNGLLLFSPADRIDKALMGDQGLSMISAAAGAKKQIMFGMVVYGWKSAYQTKRLGNYLKTLFSVPDVVLNVKDLKPGLLSPFIFFLYWINSLKSRRNIPAAFIGDCNWDGDKG